MTILEGQLVRLRASEPGDVDRYDSWFNDVEVTRYLESARYPVSHAAELEWVSARTNRPLGADNMFFAIDVLEDGRHIGSIDLHAHQTEDRKATLGIAIGDKTCWDKGYGSDAIRTLLRFAFDEVNLHRVMLHVDERNARGIAAYRKCGFMEEGRLRDDRYAGGRYWATVVMGVLAEEFRALA
jgi:RimJ/RimL family protein N-acetyltransferase